MNPVSGQPMLSSFIPLELFEKGGIAMIPLALCSVIAVGVIIERVLWGAKRSKVVPSRLLQEVKAHASNGSLKELTEACANSDSALGRIASTAIRYSSKPRTMRIEAIEAVGRHEAMKLHKNLGILSTIAAISPLLGLLGTVFGMISTFAALEQQGIGNAPALAGGISEALITTATGLSIAIPALVFHRYFAARAKRLCVELETIGSALVDATSDEVPASTTNAASS